MLPEIAGAAVYLAPAALLALGAHVLYGAYLHPAWRRERRVRQACAKAFEEDYRLVRIHLQPDAPSGTDLWPTLPVGRSDPTRYFTYRIETDTEPDESRLSREERQLVRHYMRRSSSVPHHGKDVLHPEKPSSPVQGSGGG